MPGDDAYTYPGSRGVLRNRLNIRTRDDLEAAENAFVSAAWAAYAGEAPTVFDYDYLRAVHQRMFEPLYPWAGVARTVAVVAASADLAYCDPAQIEAETYRLFADLRTREYLRGTDRWGFASGLAEHWRRLTYTHPFRDGNTRSQVFYVSRLAEAAEHPIDWEKVDPVALRGCRMAAVKGFPGNLAEYLYERLG